MKYYKYKSNNDWHYCAVPDNEERFWVWQQTNPKWGVAIPSWKSFRRYFIKYGDFFFQEVLPLEVLVMTGSLVKDGQADGYSQHH
jgi:hypothetical protein